MDIVQPAADRDDEHDVSRDPVMQRGHPIQDQGLLRLVQVEACAETDPKDHIAVDGVFLLRDELVAVVLGDVRGEENVLLQYPFLFEFRPHVPRERPRLREQQIRVLS